MSNKQTEALKKALEALEESLEYVEEEAENAQRLYGQYPTRQARIQGLKDDARKHMDAITAIREALAEQPAQPSNPWVGLTQQDIDIAFDDTQEGGGFDDFAHAIEAKLREKNAAPCKLLTDAQIGAVAADIWGSILIAPQSYQAFARAIEAAHGIKGEQK